MIASVRHEDTTYDELLMSGVDRADARECVHADVDRMLERWRRGSRGSDASPAAGGGIPRGGAER